MHFLIVFILHYYHEPNFQRKTELIIMDLLSPLKGCVICVMLMFFCFFLR